MTFQRLLCIFSVLLMFVGGARADENNRFWDDFTTPYFRAPLYPLQKDEPHAPVMKFWEDLTKSNWLANSLFRQTESSQFPATRGFGEGRQSIFLDMPRRTFLLGEPIHFFVGFANGDDTPVFVGNMYSDVLNLIDPDGEPCGFTLNMCDVEPTQIGAHETRWIDYELSLYEGVNKEGNYAVKAQVRKNLAKGGIVSEGFVQSKTITLTLREPVGEDKAALDWVRAKLAEETARAETKSDRAVTDTMLIAAVRDNASEIIKRFPTSTYAKYYQRKSY